MPSTVIRGRRRLVIALLAVLALGVVIGLLLAGGGREGLAPGRGPGNDPLAYRPGAETMLSARAAAGLSHVLYAKSPGGAIATAARVARFRPLVEAAARRADERFNPAKSLAATCRYLQFARGKLGGHEDLAVESYHMGVGNLQGALSAYGERDVSYAALYFGSTPLRHSGAFKRLAALGDDSATYLWRVLAAREIMRLYRGNRPELLRLQGLHARKATAEEVLHPRGVTRVYATPADIARARARGELRPLPANAAELHLRIDPSMGELAPKLHRRPALYRLLRPEALATLIYIAAGVDEISGEGLLTVTSTVRDREYQRLLVKGNIQATRAYSLHTTGYSFDILRRYKSRSQAVAFQFMLDRLTALDLIAWAVEPSAIHITVSSEARSLLPVLAQIK